MPYITVGKENTQDIDLYFEDHGQGETLVLIHGYPFSGMAWEKEQDFFLKKGYRVVTYDRRGFGKSSHPVTGYDFTTFANDLNILLNELDLNDVTLVGHSMGSGEVVRYLGEYGSSRVRRGVLVSPIPPFLLKTDENSKGVEKKVFEGFKESIREDRYAFMTQFLKNFYNLGLLNHKVSDEKLRADFHLGTSSSPVAFLKCVDTWIEDFRQDLTKIDVPLLVIHGDKDQVLPIDSTGKRLNKEYGLELKIISGGSHGIPWTHAEEISNLILEFMQRESIRQPKEEDRSLEVH